MVYVPERPYKCAIEIVDLRPLKLKIKGCRHCGGEAKLHRRPSIERNSPKGFSYWVQCYSCSMQTGKYHGVGSTQLIQFVLQCWNRVPEDGGFSGGPERGEVSAGLATDGRVRRGSSY